MELQSVTVNGFRRFHETTQLRTNGKLVAILGPNEAGKTSLLYAIREIGNTNEIDKGNLSRLKDHNDNDIIISARFRLNQDDLNAANINNPTWYILSKKVNGKRTYRFDPPIPTRDISNRQKLISSIGKVRANNKLWGRIVQENDDAIDTFDNAELALSSKDETLKEEQFEYLTKISTFISRVSLENDPLYFREMPEKISAHVDLENLKTPEEFAVDVIRTRVPKILFFSNEDRLLQGSYNVDDLAGDIPPALANLCRIANLDIRKFVQVISEDDTPNIAKLKSQANDELKLRFSESWSQSGVHVAFEVSNRRIEVLVREEDYNFTKLAERSDGLRQFVALQAFTTCERAEDPILLIDEAEMRLHYDAQADLIQMLSKQTVSSKIIYTTHSAGCLPEDLGNGVRLVESRETPSKSPYSTVKNNFWNRNEGGLEPLLFGMGAATLAFFPIRRALLTEGESDMLLLPTMFREALKTQNLSFQVVPGLSKTSGINLPILSRNGKGVAFALDFDSGGKEIEKKL